MAEFQEEPSIFVSPEVFEVTDQEDGIVDMKSHNGGSFREMIGKDVIVLCDFEGEIIPDDVAPYVDLEPEKGTMMLPAGPITESLMAEAAYIGAGLSKLIEDENTTADGLHEAATAKGSEIAREFGVSDKVFSQVVAMQRETLETDFNLLSS